MNLHKVKKSNKKNQPKKFKVSSFEIACLPVGRLRFLLSLAMTKCGLFVIAKKLRNNFVAYYLLLANASPRKLAPYYHTFIYTFIRKIAQPVIKLQQKVNRARFASYLPNLTKRGISAAVIIAMIFVQVMNVGAFEAHVVNITATVVNDIPLIQPNGGQFCNIDGATITIATTLAGANIIYTINGSTDGSDLACPSTGNDYTAPFTIHETATIRARTCHGGKQSAMVFRNYQVDQQYCNGGPGPGPSSSPEICDGLDNNFNGIIDDVYETKIASSSPNLTRLDTLFNVTASTTLSDDIYAVQTNNSATPKYIYLNWVFPQIATTSLIATSTLSLEHHEENASTSIEWWNGSAYEQVCNQPEGGTDTIDHCDLSSFITSGIQAQNVTLRVRIEKTTSSATESLDWAEMEIEYKKAVNCGLLSCGNGVIDAGETCDDGNQLNQDGCSSTCQIEPATSCVKINEVYYDVDSGHGSEGSNEWVELYNACSFATDLNNWTIKDNSASASASTTIPELNLASHGFAVLSPSSTTWDFWSIPAEAVKVVLGSNIGSSGGLSNTGDRLTLKDNNGIIADQVSYGSDPTYFDLSVFEPSSTDGKSIARIVKGIDTDLAADWAYLANPNPGTNPHPSANSLNFIDNSLMIDQVDNIIKAEVQAELIPAASDLNNMDQPVIDLPIATSTATSTSDSVSTEKNIEPEQPAEKQEVAESNEELITPTEPAQTEEITETNEITEPVETTNDESNEINNIQPEAVNPEPATEPEPSPEESTVIEAPQQPAVEPAAISAEATTIVETTTL